MQLRRRRRRRQIIQFIFSSDFGLRMRTAHNSTYEDGGKPLTVASCVGSRRKPLGWVHQTRLLHDQISIRNALFLLVRFWLMWCAFIFRVLMLFFRPRAWEEIGVLLFEMHQVQWCCCWLKFRRRRRTSTLRLGLMLFIYFSCIGLRKESFVGNNKAQRYFLVFVRGALTWNCRRTVGCSPWRRD